MPETSLKADLSGLDGMAVSRPASASRALLEVRVAAVVDEALDIRTFELVEPSGLALPRFDAGFHIDVHLPDGLIRQYSLCNDPAESRRYLIGVLKDAVSRGGSRTMHERVKCGDKLTISAPKNHFALAHDAGHHLLLGGGIGITPLISMADRLASEHADFTLHYATRSRDRTAFHERLARSSYADRVHFHVDDGPTSQRLDLPVVLGAAGVDTHLYVCGPTGFIEASLDAARRSGWPEARLHCEFFVNDRSEATDEDGAFRVRLASSGRVVDIPVDTTVVDALAAAGIVVPTSCGQGVCGTCMVRVLDGIPDHRDLYLTLEEQAQNDRFTPCCSRSRSSLLVLDL